MNLKGKSRQILASSKQGLLDMKTVLEEGGVKLFAKQAATLIVLVLIYHYAATALDTRSDGIRVKIEALQAQQNNEKDYLFSKSKLLKLEPRFPDGASKNDWLLKQMDTIFRESSIVQRKVASSQTENNSNNAYTVVSVPIEMNASYAEFANLVAAIEGREEFLKVSEFSIVKSPISEALGTNTIKLRVDAVFPVEKVAKKLFKDYSAGGKK